MPQTVFLLSALVAPGSVEAELGKVQADIFDRHGLASALALPPLIPIAFLDAACADRGLLREMDSAVGRGWRMHLAGTAWIAGHLIACIDSGGAWEKLRTCAAARFGSAGAGLFPEAEGFFLGCGEAAPGLRDSITPELPEISFSSAALVLMNITTGPDRTGWWRAVRWETIEERPFRGRKEQ